MNSLRSSTEPENISDAAGEGFEDVKAAVQGKEWRAAQSALEGKPGDLAACAVLAAAEEEKDMIASLALLRASGSALRGMGGAAPAKLFECVEDVR